METNIIIPENRKQRFWEIMIPNGSEIIDIQCKNDVGEDIPYIPHRDWCSFVFCFQEPTNWSWKINLKSESVKPETILFSFNF